jgi:hypothetical protein
MQVTATAPGGSGVLLGHGAGLDELAATRFVFLKKLSCS